jgi:CBS domain-containing protein
LRVEELMTSPVHTAAPDSSLKEMARFLVQRGMGCVPIVDHAGSLIGIVTEADLMQLELHRDPRRHMRPDRDEPSTPPPTTAGEIMTTPVVAVPVDFDVADAARIMLEQHITRIPVVDGEEVVGIVSRTDLLRLLTRDDNRIAADVSARLADVPGEWASRVQEGVVTLVGSGPHNAEQIASTVAWAVPGVIGVQATTKPEA